MKTMSLNLNNKIQAISLLLHMYTPCQQIQYRIERKHLAQSEVLPIITRSRKAVNTDDVNYSLSTSL